MRKTLKSIAAAMLAGLTLITSGAAYAQPVAPPSSTTKPTTRPRANEPAPRREPHVPESIQVVRDVIYAETTDDQGKAVQLKMDTAFLKQSDGKPMPVII